MRTRSIHWILLASSRASAQTVGTEDVIRVRASLDDTVATWVQWEGQTLIYKPGQAPRIAFNVLGMNVARTKKLDDGSYDILARELQLYLDPISSEIVHMWENPFTNESVNVIHVQNQPVYQTIPASASYPTRNMSNDYSTFTFNIPLAYPNPLNPTDDPASPLVPYQGVFQALYSAIESFTFTYADEDLADSSLYSVPSTQIYWTRTSPLLPWMKSPDTNATLLFVANGAKIPKGFDGLHPTLRRVICDKLRIYGDAPIERVRPGGGVTSWSFFTQPEVFTAWRNGTEFPIREE